MKNGLLIGFAGIDSVGNSTVFSTSDGYIDAPQNTSDIPEYTDTSSSDNSSNIDVPVSTTTEISADIVEEITTVFEEVITEDTTESSTEIQTEIWTEDITVSGNEIINNGNIASAAESDYSALIETVMLADINNVEALTKIDYKVNAIIFVLLFFWSIDRIRKTVRGFYKNDKYRKHDS